MAVEISDGAGTPHATSYSDLLTKLETFANANGWTTLEDTADKLVLQGDGGASDEIIVAIQKYANVSTDTYGWYLQGYTGYNGSGILFAAQPGAITTNPPALPLWNGTIPYWFIASGRRIIVVAKVSTTYQMAYLGFCLPFASPGQYPYPLCVGGSFIQSLGATEGRYTGSDGRSSAFWTYQSSGNTTTRNALQTRLVSGAWYSAANSISGQQSAGMYPYNQAHASLIRQALNDDPVIQPIEIHMVTPNVNRLAELDGVYHVSGFGIAVEDIITIGSDDYLVVQNVFRNSIADFCAVKLA